LCRLLPLYFPRDAYEEQVAATKLPTDVGDENGETVISERKIRISALPASSPVSTAPLLDDVTNLHHSMPSNRWVHHYFRVDFFIVLHQDCGGKSIHRLIDFSKHHCSQRCTLQKHYSFKSVSVTGMSQLMH
jgi:hypothetical protein